MLQRSPILVFPAGMAAARRFAEAARARGEVLIGASSLAFDPARPGYEEWARLPYYDAPDFAQELAALVRARGILRIHTPHPVVHAHLRPLLPCLLPECVLDEEPPYQAELSGYRGWLREAEGLARAGDGLGGGAPRSPALGLEAAAALLRQAHGVPGMCDDAKLWALAAIARHAPPGDVVEIGSWWGKSAVILGWLAMRHGIGSLLCVDPWSVEGTQQSHEGLDAVSAAADHEEAARIFLVNLLGLGAHGTNYLRLPSVQGAAHYRADPVVHSAAFGETRYAGEIALLHIDGNHAHEQVRADVEAWMPVMRDGGWLVLDDYLWPFGDGPRRVGDRLLWDRAGDIACAVTAGSALFLRFQSQ
ncbi:class I SAM-dependent methyltransferase [Roseomonas sp. SSH11]|uniref:Class I SAM-dependent methyltransferase n=1 Tax=Pararoseomonas baculiformis TaxID=2820812 RepID=A0ABS4AAU5_9PROT|nr:class I SAM-dependent methyltransferase [Pararoseomonas baculiformis]MBP0444121.1 class I SAM-dependent methyltransferase [Pararoseomonas baculiformis]